MEQLADAGTPQVIKQDPNSEKAHAIKTIRPYLKLLRASTSDLDDAPARFIEFALSEFSKQSPSSLIQGENTLTLDPVERALRMMATGQGVYHRFPDGQLAPVITITDLKYEPNGQRTTDESGNPQILTIKMGIPFEHLVNFAGEPVADFSPLLTYLKRSPFRIREADFPYSQRWVAYKLSEIAYHGIYANHESAGRLLTGNILKLPAL